MALFGFQNFSKPGPGVRKDEPPQKPVVVFFQIFYRKFWDLIKLNLLYFASVFLLLAPMIIMIITHFAGGSLWFLLSLLPISLAGPATAGLTLVLRNDVRQEHVFLWTDYINAVRSNWRQAWLAGMLIVAAAILAIFCVPFYVQQASKNPLMILPLVIIFVALSLFIFMQYYVFVVIVTFDLKLRQIYRNALILAIMGLGRNVLLTLFCGAVLLLCIYSPLAMAFLPLLWLSTVGMVVNFAVWPLILKYMIANQKIPDN